MIPSIETLDPLDVDSALADDDTAREYEELSEMEDLGAPSGPIADEGSLLEVAGELAFVRDELEELAALEDRGTFESVHMAEADTTADRAARRYEGMDVDELDALAHWDEEAESRALPDDEIEREAELIGA